MKHFKKKKLILPFLILTLYACHKDVPDTNTNPHPNVDVYTAGWVADTTQIYAEVYPTYWKNGKALRLNFDYEMPYGLGKQGWANSIAVSGNDIYVAGHRTQYSYFTQGLTQGLYWKNGMASEPPSMTLYCQLGPIVISNNDVYIVSNEILPPSDAPYYLKNGNVISMDHPGGEQGSVTYAVAVSGNDVYVAGAGLNISNVVGLPYYWGRARYWKNGILVNLSDGSEPAYATAIAASGNDVYAAGIVVNGLFVPDGSGTGNGNTNRRGIFWKNGTPFYLTDGETDVSISSIAISGNDIYITGTQSDGALITNGRLSVAKYWKNGVAINLTDGSHSAEAKSIAIAGDDVYVAGLEYDGELINGFPTAVAKYWKNGVPINLSDRSSDAGANSIFLVSQ